jgi:hypothetical protein
MIVCKQLEAAHMHSGQHGDRKALVDSLYVRRREVPVEIDLAMLEPVA